MTYLDCSVNRLTALDISNNSKLEDLDCSWNYLKLSDVTGIPSGLTADVYTASKDFFEDEETGEIYEFEGAFLGGFKFSPQKTGSPPIGDFKDVFTTDWYAKYVEWAADNRVVTGYPDSTFRPNNTMTRAEFVQVLYSLAGKPAVTPTTAFTDVKSDDWYVKAVSWAVESGITSGVGGGEFAPGGSVTREQAVAFLYKYAKLKGDNKDYSGVALTFYDKADISDWAIPAVKWSAANKVVGGYPDGTFGPQNTATRAEVVTILYGYIN
ncbi:MAG: S-layer homology domain-containing protein [Oscillospiraceae bacterium]|nr:S-layer homology domain-containing protein [Oscillospiraceae bacterium]